MDYSSDEQENDSLHELVAAVQANLPECRGSSSSKHASVLGLAALSCEFALFPPVSISAETGQSHTDMLDGCSPEQLLERLSPDALLPVVEGLLMHLKICRQVLMLLSSVVTGKG